MRNLGVVVLICAELVTASARADRYNLSLTDDTFINGNEPATVFGTTLEPRRATGGNVAY